MSRLDSFKARALALAQSGYYYGLPPLQFELSFEEGFEEAREWLALASTKEELERLCQTSRAKRSVRLWHIADIDADDEHVRFWG